MTLVDYENEIMVVNIQFSRSHNNSGTKGPIWAEVSFRIDQPNEEDCYLVEQFQLDREPDELDQLISAARSQMSKRLAALSQLLK